MRWWALGLAGGLWGAPTHADEAIVVRGPPSTKAPGTSVGGTEAALVAGTQGDASKVIGALPGVARTSFDSGGLVLWGSAPGDTRIFVDGVEIPFLFHGGALRAVVPTELVQSVSVTPGGQRVQHGRGLGGVVQLTTSSPDQGVHGSFGAGALDAHGSLSVAGDAAAFVAARFGYVDRLLPLVTRADVGDYVALPRYRDYQVKASIVLGTRETLALVMLGARDDLRRALPSADPSAVRGEVTRRAFHRLYLAYRHVLDNGAAVEATPFVGIDDAGAFATFGDVATSADATTLRYGLRASYRVELRPTVWGAVGFDGAGGRAQLGRRGSLTIPAREGDPTYFGRPPGEDVGVDTWTTHTIGLAPWAEVQAELGPLTVVAGLRAEGVVVDTSRLTPRVSTTPEIGDTRAEVALDPRLSLRARASEHVTLAVSLGRHHQPPSAEELSPVFGTPGLGSSSAFHATGTISTRLGPLSVEMVGYHKTLSNLPVRTRASPPRLAYALVQDGEGRAYGVQWIVRKRLGDGLFGWISYTLSRSERRLRGEPTYRLFDGDQPHALAVVVSQAVGAWTFGARLRWASGLPRTPVVGHYQDLRTDRYEPVFGVQNDARLPPFFALDLRVDRAFALGASARAIVSLDLLDATFRSNAEDWVYAADFTRRATLTGVPTLLIASARVEL